MRIVKRTREIPDPLFRRAKDRAAERGIALRQFLTEAIEEKLSSRGSGSKPWMQMVGGLQHLTHETARINRLIEGEFERIENRT